MAWLLGSRSKKEDEGYIFIGAKVLELNKKNEIDIDLYLRKVDGGNVVIVKGQTKNVIDLPRMKTFPQKYIVSKDYYDSDAEMESDLLNKPTEFITLIFMHVQSKGTYKVRISTMAGHSKSLRYEKFEEYKTISDQYPLSFEDYTAFEEALNSIDIPIWYNDKIITEKMEDNNNQHNPEFDQQGEIGTTSKTRKNSDTQEIGGNFPMMVMEVPQQKRGCISEVTIPKNVEEFGRLMIGVEEQTIISNITSQSDTTIENTTTNMEIEDLTTENIPTTSTNEVNLEDYKILHEVFSKTENTIKYLEALWGANKKLIVNTEEILFRAIDKKVRDAHFFRRYYGDRAQKPNYIEYFEDMVGHYIEEYKIKNKVDYSIGSENIKRIRKNTRMILAWKYLRSRDLKKMDAYNLASIIIHIEWFIFEREERPKREDFSFQQIREYCKNKVIVKKKELPANFMKLPEDIINKLPFSLPIEDWQKISGAVQILREDYDIDRLPESYIKPKPALPVNYNDLREEFRNTFPIDAPHMLKQLNQIRYRLKRFYTLPEKLPENYFNLPMRIKKTQDTVRKPELPENCEDVSAGCNRYLPWKRGGYEDYFFNDLIRDLKEKYTFEKLPESYFYQRSKLPELPSHIQLPDEIKIPATSIQEARELSRYLYPLYEYKIPLSKEWINFEKDKRISLPEDMGMANRGAGTNFPIYRINLKTEVRKLRKVYKFYRIPERWIKSDYVKKPILPDLQTVIRDLQNERGVDFTLPIKDRNKHTEIINKLKTFYFFRYLPKEFTEYGELPTPDFPVVEGLVYE